MPAPRIDINHRAVREVLTGPEMKRLLRSEAEKIASRAGDGIEVQVSDGRNRARATVRTATTEARAAEAKRHALRNALGR